MGSLDFIVVHFPIFAENAVDKNLMETQNLEYIQVCSATSIFRPVRMP